VDTPSYELYYNTSDQKFKLWNRISGISGISTRGLVVSGNYEGPAATDATKVRVIQNQQNQNYRGFVAFLTTPVIYFEAGGSSLFQSVTKLRIFTCVVGGGGHTPGDGNGGKVTPLITANRAAQQALHNILPVNPFTSNLTLYFQEHPEQPVTAQLFDVSGRVHVQQTIEPGNVSENRYVLNTADLLPGMYFLRLETAPGVFSTHKVMKYEQ